MFSIIIPLAKEAPIKKLSVCLDAISNQTFAAKETILISNKVLTDKFINRYQKRLPKLKYFQVDLNKSEARNYGCGIAKGKYVVNIDVDQYLDHNSLETAKNMVRLNKCKTIALTEKVLPKRNNLILRIRSLGRKIGQDDFIGITPQIIEKKLFLKLGGYDESSPIIDEYTLGYKLKRYKVKKCITKPLLAVEDEDNFLKVIKRKYVRGRALKQFVSEYPSAKEVISAKRFLVLFKNPKIYLEDPLATLLYFSFKPFEWFVFWLGIQNPMYYKPYRNKFVAQNYDKFRSSSNYQLYKQFSELTSLEKLINNEGIKTALEFGSGTGRITSYLLNKKINVLATEPSSAMADIYKKKKIKAKLLLLKAQDVNLKKTFDLVIGIRFIWHIGSEEAHNKIIENCSKHSKKYVILDFACGRGLLEYFYHIFYFIYGHFVNQHFHNTDYHFTLDRIKRLSLKNKLEIDSVIPLGVTTPVILNLVKPQTAKKLFPFIYQLDLKLAKIIPPGRLLIRFKKK